MATIPIHPIAPRHSALQSQLDNPLPQLLHTPSGLALLEMQGTIHLPDPEDMENLRGNHSVRETPIGRLVFPDYRDETQESGDTAWMNRVYLYVGEHQRLTGQVKKLSRPLAIIRRRSETDRGDGMSTDDQKESQAEELEVVEIVKWKILFSQRPEPVGTWNGEV
ncbi:MAG: hypothetical protein M1818_005740 [Claussenomyces sp. TS43310]|nr:MAG: hypothetical protein M1818_005740 [Claussenomyces sp. TS43310]